MYWTEEQEIFQKLYSAIFTSDSPVEAAQSAPFGDFAALRNQIARGKPDILMVGCKNISLVLIRELSQLQGSFPAMGVILLVSALRYDDLLLVRQHIESTKSPFGFFFKKSITRTEQIYNIVSLVKMGQIVIDPTLSNLMHAERDKASFAGGLTPREMEILNLVARGYTNIAISDSLCIDVKTVRHHINNIYSKLQTSDSFDNRHPRVSATNLYLRLTGQLSLDENIME
jgi:DNA-binding NarL/FixJ family response regulator